MSDETSAAQSDPVLACASGDEIRHRADCRQIDDIRMRQTARSVCLSRRQARLAKAIKEMLDILGALE